MKTITAFVVRAISLCIHYSRWVIAGAILIAIASSWYAGHAFFREHGYQPAPLRQQPGRQRELVFEKAFPQFDITIVVVDAPTPELVQEASAALAAKLRPQKNFFVSIDETQGSAFFTQNGLLFEPIEQLEPQMTMLTQAQRLVQVLAGDPSLRGVVRALQFGLLGVQSGKLKLDNMVWPLTLAANTLDQVNANKPASFSWQALVQGQEPKSSDLMRFLKVQPVLDYSELQPGMKASNAIRAAVADLDLAAKYQARVRLTGPVPMNDDQFATIKENAGLNAVVTIAVVLFILWLALRWWQIILAVFISLAVGLSITAALGILMVGSLNLISVYFAVLFVGLGVDFGHPVQRPLSRGTARGRRSVRGAAACRPPRRRTADARGAGDGRGLSFVSADRLPRAFRARPDRRRRHADRVLHQHHLAAGAAELVQAAERAEASSVTRFLPRSMNFSSAIARRSSSLPRCSFSARRRCLYWLKFDFNPMNLRNRNVESVATYLELQGQPDNAANDIVALEPSLSDGRRGRPPSFGRCRRSRG